MHIAAAVNPRTLGIHTWSDPRKGGPLSFKRRRMEGRSHRNA